MAKHDEEEDRLIHTFTFQDKTVKLIMPDFQDEMDVERITYIDMNNIIGEIVTFPRIVNRLGIMLAEANNAVSGAKMNLEIAEANFKADLRNKDSGNYDAKGNDKGWTAEQMESKWKSSDAFKAKRSLLNKKIYNADILNSTYWAAKDKSDKLNNLSKNLTRDDLSSLKTCVINSIKIVVKEGLFKDR